jgi:hypothetical protein
MEKAMDGYLLKDKAATAKPEVEELWLERKISAAGVVLRHLSDDIKAKFISDKNQQEPHVIWETLWTHFKSSSSQNQAKVYQKFLKVSFKSTLADFFTQIDNNIANMRAVGLKIKVPTDTQPDVNKTLLAEQIVSMLPGSFDHTKELLFTKRPLTLKIVRDHLEAKNLDNDDLSSNPTIKTETALKAKAAVQFCENGRHNPKARQKESRCYQLHPEIKEADKKKRKEEDERRR